MLFPHLPTPTSTTLYVSGATIFGSFQISAAFLSVIKFAFFLGLWIVVSLTFSRSPSSVYLLSCSHNDDMERRVFSLPPGGRNAISSVRLSPPPSGRHDAARCGTSNRLVCFCAVCLSLVRGRRDTISQGQYVRPLSLSIRSLHGTRLGAGLELGRHTPRTCTSSPHISVPQRVLHDGPSAAPPLLPPLSLCVWPLS